MISYEIHSQSWDPTRFLIAVEACIKSTVPWPYICYSFVFFLVLIEFLPIFLSCFMFSFMAMRHVGSQFLDQELNLHPQHWKLRTDTQPPESTFLFPLWLIRPHICHQLLSSGGHSEWVVKVGRQTEAAVRKLKTLLNCSVSYSSPLNNQDNREKVIWF